MNYFSFILFIFSISVGVITIAISFRMYKAYRLRYLLSYGYYLIFFTVFGFLSLTGRYLAETILKDLSTSPHTVTSMGLVFSFLAFPIMVIAWYMFIHMAGELLEKRLPVVLKWGYIIFGIFSVLVYAKLVKDYIDFPGLNLSGTASIIAALINIIFLVIIYITLSHLYVRGRGIADKNKQKAVKLFACLNLVVYSVYFAAMYIILQSKALIFLFMPPLHFFLNLPPLLYLRSYLHKYCVPYRLKLHADEDINVLLSRFELSQREQEIVGLILQGKSNREIADELFISIKTVKNIIYNLYKRFNLKNRVQLTNFFRGSG